MYYSDYFRKVLRTTKFVRKVKRFKIPIIISIALILIAVAVLLSTRGLVYDKTACPAEIEYGSDIPYSAGAFMSSVKYEYREIGGKWTSKKPVRTGKYQVRAVSERIGGAPQYGNVYTFTIKPHKIEVTPGSAAVYGDDPGVTAELCYKDTIDCTKYDYADLSQTNTTVTPLVDGIVISDRDGNDVTSDYIIATKTGPIAFSKRKIEITAASKTVDYNGAEICYDGKASVTVGSLAQGDEIFEDCNANITDVGSITADPVYRIINVTSGKDTTINYDITTVSGSITVDQRVVNVTTASLAAIYNGSEFSAPSFVLDAGTPLVSGHDIRVKTDENENKISAKATNAGAIDNTMLFEVVDADGNDVTDNYKINITLGTINIKPRPITVTTPSRSWLYDGIRHTYVTTDNIAFDTERVEGGDICEEYTAIVQGHGIAMPDEKDAASVLNHSDGAVANKFDISVYNGTTDVTGNYDIAYDYGTLSIEQITLLYESQNATRQYDGTPLTAGAVITNSGAVVSGETVEIRATGSVVAPGSAANPAEIAKVMSSGGIDVTAGDNYVLDDENSIIGTLTVTNREITVRPVDVKKIYDGRAVEFAPADFETVSAIGVADGEIGAATFYTVKTGETEIAQDALVDVEKRTTFIESFTVTRDGADVTEYYHIVFDTGVAEIIARPVTLVTASHTWVYDGRTHRDGEVGATFDLATDTSFDGADVSDIDSALVPGHSLDIPEENDLPSVSDYTEFGVENMFAISIKDGEVDKTYNYSITNVYGTLKIEKRPITVTTMSNTWIYDGQKHSNPTVLRNTFDRDRVPDGADISDITDAIVDGRTACSPILTDPILWNWFPSVTDVSDTRPNNNAFVIKIYRDDKYVEKTYNYDIAYVYGTLTILPRPIKVTTASAKWVYDGAAHSAPTGTAELDIAARDTLVNDYGADIAYDGGFALVSGQTITANGAYEILTDVAKNVENKFVIGIDGGDINNYDVTKETYGKLTVLPRPIKVATGSGKWIYDGQTHKNGTITPPMFDSDRYNNDITYRGAQLDSADNALVAGQAVQLPDYNDLPGAVDVADTYNGNNDFTITISGGDINNYAVSYEYGTLTVLPRPIKVTTDSKTWIYDGQEHSSPTGTATLDTAACDELVTSGADSYDDGFALADGQTITADGAYETLTDVEENIVNMFVIAIDGGDINNYNVTKETYGTLAVLPRPILLATPDRKWVYDGMEHFDGVIDFELLQLDIIPDGAILSDIVDPIVPGHTIISPDEKDLPKVKVVADTKAHNNKFAVTIKNSDGDDKTNNYHITYHYGQLTIVPRPIIVTTASKAWVYDGQAHSYGLVASDAFDKNKFLVDESYRDEFGDVIPYDTDTFGIVSGQIASAIYSAEDPLPSVTNVADNEPENNIFAVAIKDGDDDVTENYYIAYVYGTLTVKPRPIIVTTGSGKWIYDGLSHDNSGYYIELDTAACLVIDPDFTGTVAVIVGTDEIAGGVPSVVDVADTKPGNNKFAIAVKDGGNDISDNYEIAYVYGTLTVKPRPITVTTGSGKWIYDGLSHDNNGYNIELDTAACLAIDPDFTGTVAVIVGTDEIAGGVPSVVDVADTKPGNNKFAIAVKDGGNDISDNYEIAYVYGMLTVLPRPIKVTTDSKTWIYDGKAHSSPTGTAALDTAACDELVTSGAHNYDDGFALADGQTIMADGAYEILTDVAEGVVNKFVIGIAGGDINNYSVTNKTYGVLTIVPRPIKVTTDSKTWIYDGQKHTAPTGTAELDIDKCNELIAAGAILEHGEFGLAGGQEISCEKRGEAVIWDVGSMDNRFVITITTVMEAGDEADNKFTIAIANGDINNYDLTETNYGKLTMVKRPIIVTTASETFEYDGKAHSNDNFDTKLDIEACDRLVAEGAEPYDGSFALVDGYTLNIHGEPPTVKFVSDNKEGNNKFEVRNGIKIPHSYEIKYEYGTIEITRRALTIKVKDKNKPYDGTPLLPDGYEITGGSFAETDEITRIEYATKVDGVITDEPFTEVGKRVGTIKLIEITHDDGAVTYLTGDDVNNCYDIEITDGELEIERLKATVTVKDAGKEYDGKELMPSDCETFGLTGGDRLEVTEYGTKLVGTDELAIEPFIYVGKRNGTVKTYAIYDPAGNDVTDRYEVTVVDGELEITPRAITLKADSKKIYDGMPLDMAQYQIVSGSLVDHDAGSDKAEITVVSFAAGVQTAEPFVHVGVRIVKISSCTITAPDGTVVYSDGGTDNCYTVTFADGTAEISAREITLIPQYTEKYYDGKPLLPTEYDVVSEFGLADGDTPDITYFTMNGGVIASDPFVDVGERDTGLTVNFIKTADGTDVTYCYAISYENGSAKIKARPITVKTASGSWTYDGAYHSKPEINSSALDIAIPGETDALADGHKLVVSDKIAPTEVKDHSEGKVDNVFEVKVIDADGNDVTDNYEISYDFGILEINRIVLYYRSDSAEKYYDGTPLTAPNVQIINADAIVDGEIVVIKANGTITYPGSVQNTAALVTVSDGDNYEVGDGNDVGTLTVKKISLTVSTGSDKKRYDGTPLVCADVDYVVTAGVIPDDHVLTVTATGTITNAGSVANTSTVKLTDADGKDVTASVLDITSKPGVLTVEPRNITVKTGSANKKYDGTPLTAPDMTVVSGDGLVGGHDAVVLYEFGITHVWESGDNKSTAKVVDGKGADVTNNYNIAYEYGTLEITKRSVYIKSASKTFVYDGNEHWEASVVTLDMGDGLADGDSVIVLDGFTKIKDVGSKPNVLQCKIENADKLNVTEDYETISEENGTMQYGTLTVVEKPDGDGDGDIDWNGVGPTPDGDGDREPVAVAKIRTEYAGGIYLRKQSYGNYTLTSGASGAKAPFRWSAPVKNTDTFAYNGGAYGMRQLTSLALGGTSAVNIDIQILNKSVANVLPYYIGFDYSTSDDISDTTGGDEYSLSFIPYEYVSDNGAALSLPGAYMADELAYRQFVKANYTAIADSTKSAMLELAAGQGIYPGDENIVSRIVEYIRNAAVYEKSYDADLDFEDDPAVAFLKTYKQGICQHYAMSTTMMLRALGYPARYCVGLFATANGTGDWEDVTNDRAHAWTEVYIDGVGWVQVDATGGVGGENNDSDDSGEGGGTGNGNILTILNLKPIDIYSQDYPVMPKDVVVDVDDGLRLLLQDGWEYEARVAVRKNTAGERVSYVQYFKLYDYNNRFVYGFESIDGTVTETCPNDDVKCTFYPGKLVSSDKTIVRIMPKSYTKTYDGTPLTVTGDRLVAQLPAELSGYRFEISGDLSFSLTDVGCINIEKVRNDIEKLNDWYRVYNDNGDDVTAEFDQTYYPVMDYDLTRNDYELLKKDLSKIGVLTVNPIKLKITTYSLEKEYDGTPLTVESIYPEDMLDYAVKIEVLSGSMPKGHNISYEFTASITDIGRVDNSVEITITDASGADASKNYKLISVLGSLTVY